MTNAHERITLPPISSFDVSPPAKHNNKYPAGPSRRGAHARGSLSWDKSSNESGQYRSEQEFIHDGRPDPSTYDAPEGSVHDYSVSSSAHSHSNYSPYSEPAGLVAPYEPNLPTSRPRSSSAAFDRREATAPYPQFQLAPVGRQRPAPYVSSREPSPESWASSLRSLTNSPHTQTRPRSGMLSSPQAAAGTGLPVQVAAFINTTPEDAQDAQATGTGPPRRRISPVRKRKALDMAEASPESDDKGISPEPSESEAKKKYKKKMNVRHYRAQNKDAMTQLRDALPEHMRPPERQAKAYVTLSAIKHIHDLTAENERLRAENERQAHELAARRGSEPRPSASGEEAESADDTATKAEELAGE
ncbi:hypothetical protein BC834DRAFT_969967 [Gloeopeniophorella convolvens]|nr:hypothetical protein BC834DRAFT_969967 [Gloeopeniophorella convolvens]